jgi:hypothetical protein
MKANQETKPTTNLVEEISRFLESLLVKLKSQETKISGVGRPRILPAMCLWGALLMTVLNGMKSQTSVWRLLSITGLWNYPRYEVSDQAVYNRLEKGGTSELETLFKWISEALKERLAPYVSIQLASFATGVYALDTTTLDQVARYLPKLRGVAPGDDQLIPGKLSAVFDIRRQQWHHIQHVESMRENDKVSARDLLATIEKGALILADLGYFGFRWFDDLTDGGYFWLSRWRKKTSFEVLHVFYQSTEVFDGVIWLGKYRGDRAAHAVRLITYQSGSTTYRYITNVLDPRTLSIHDVAQLYARRWDIELAFKLIKRELGLHLLWSAKTVVILQQVWAVLIISQILQALRFEIAGRAQVDPFDVSLKLLIEYMPVWTSQEKDVLTLIVEDGRRAGFIRPSRRIRISVPFVSKHDLRPLPPDLVLQRDPRYAQRRC